MLSGWACTCGSLPTGNFSLASLPHCIHFLGCFGLVIVFLHHDCLCKRLFNGTPVMLCNVSLLLKNFIYVWLVKTLWWISTHGEHYRIFSLISEMLWVPFDLHCCGFAFYAVLITWKATPLTYQINLFSVKYAFLILFDDIACALRQQTVPF